MTLERRTKVQEDAGWRRSPAKRPAGAHGPGTITWTEHEEIWRAYAKQYGTGQSAERIAERGGFGYQEATLLLGHEPRTWVARLEER